MQKFSTFKSATMLVECHFTEVTLEIKLLHTAVSGLPPAFGWIFQGICLHQRRFYAQPSQACLARKQMLHQLLQFSLLTQMICFQGFAISSSKVEKFTVVYLTCPAVRFQGPVSLNIAEVKVQGVSCFAYSSRLLSSHHFQLQAVRLGNTMSTIHIILCFCCLSAIYKQLQLNQLTVWLCAISNICYQILRNHMEHWNPHLCLLGCSHTKILDFIAPWCRLKEYLPPQHLLQE